MSTFDCTAAHLGVASRFHEGTTAAAAFCRVCNRLNLTAPDENSMSNLRRNAELVGLALLAGCSTKGAFVAGYVAGRTLALTIVVVLLVVIFGVLSFKFGPTLRKKRTLGGWLAGGGHTLAVLFGVLILYSENVVPLRAAIAIIGGTSLVLGHIGLWVVVLGLKPGGNESPGMHALTQGTVILIGLIVLAGGLIYLALQGLGVK